MNNSVKKIALDGTGTEIPALNVTDSYEYYEFTGTVITTGNYAIVPTGSPQAGTTFEFDFNTTIDITTNGNTFQIFGVQLSQTQLLTKLTVICRYDGSAWRVRVFGSLDQLVIVTNNIQNSAVTTAKIANEAVTNSKLAQMANNTVKANISGGSAVPTDVAITTIINSNSWSILGNSGTSSGTNFIGTLDNVDFEFKRNNVGCGKIAINNINLGLSSGINNTTGSGITGFGSTSLLANTTGNSNTGIGQGALYFNTSGSSNTSLGATTAQTVTTGSFNTILGATADVNSSSASKRIALGYGALADSDNLFAIPDDVTKIKWRSVTYTLPATDGTAGQSLKTDGAGTLYWG